MKKRIQAVFAFGIRLLGREVFWYLFFGVLTTLINIIGYYLCAQFCRLSTTVSTTVGFVLSVLFAYFTNRKWVFESKAYGVKAILNEMWKFFSVRIGTYFVDLVLMLVLVDCLDFPKLICKVAVNVLVVVLNYAASKLIVFRPGSNQKTKSRRNVGDSSDHSAE